MYEGENFVIKLVLLNCIGVFIWGDFLFYQLHRGQCFDSSHTSILWFFYWVATWLFAGKDSCFEILSSKTDEHKVQPNPLLLLEWSISSILNVNILAGSLMCFIQYKDR